MTFLKKLGEVLAKGIAIWAGFSTAVKEQYPGSSTVVQVISKDLTDIATVVVEVETIGQTLGQPGTAKLAAAGPLVAQVILQSSLMANHKIADEVGFQKACQEIAGGMADLLNSLKDNVGDVTSSKT